MQYVYALTSSKKDFYYEQCLMSVYSLRKHMPDAEIIILTDNKTAESLNGKRSKLKRIANKIISVTFPENMGPLERSRILKTTIPLHVTGDFLFIDCDTIICDSLENIKKIKEPIAAVLDGHVPLDEHKHKDYFLKREKKLGFTGTQKQGFHLNSGVILCRDCKQSKDFFNKWHELWEYGFKSKHDHHDQSAFNEALCYYGLGKNQLSGEWNCQISQGGLEFLENAKIIHYFSSEAAGKNYVSYYKLADKSVQQRIKESGDIPNDIKKMIMDPKFQFTKAHLLNDKRIISIMQSPLAFTLAELKSNCRPVFNALENVVGGARKLLKKINSY